MGNKPSSQFVCANCGQSLTTLGQKLQHARGPNYNPDCQNIVKVKRWEWVAMQEEVQNAG